LVALGSAIGVVRAIALTLANHYGLSDLVNNGTLAPATRVALGLGPMLLPAVLVAFVLTRRTQRRGLLVLTMTVEMATFALVGFVLGALDFRSPAQLNPHELLDWDVLILTAMAAAFGALCGLGAWAVSRQWLYVIDEQTGTLCWRCGYDSGSTAIGVCPECAAPAAPERFRLAGFIAGFDRLARHGRAWLIVLVVGAAAWAGYRVATGVLPIYRFYAAFAGRATPPGPGGSPSCWLYVPPGKMPSGMWDGAAACVPFADDPANGLLIAYWPAGPRNGSGPVRMRVQYAQMPVPIPMPAGAPPVSYPDEGSTRIYADLDGEQARRVIAAKSVPAGLEQALRARAAELNWSVPPGAVVGLRPVSESAVEASEYFR
jgi:hypothetical protein